MGWPEPTMDTFYLYLAFCAGMMVGTLGMWLWTEALRD